MSEEKVAIWQYAYHCLIGLDFWLRTPDDQFLPVAFHNDGDSQLIRSGPVMTREQIVGYRDSVYARCGALLDRMTPKELMEVVKVNGLRASLADRIRISSAMGINDAVPVYPMRPEKA